MDYVSSLEGSGQHLLTVLLSIFINKLPWYRIILSLARFCPYDLSCTRRHCHVFRSLSVSALNKTKNRFFVQVNFCQKLLFLHQLTQNMFIELQVQYMKIPSSNLGRSCCVLTLFLTFRTIFVHNMFSPFCKEKSFWQRFTCTYFFLEWTYYFPWLLEAPNSKRNYLSEAII